MKILALYPYVPWPLNRGAYHRAYHLLKGLAQDHEVHLLALAENGQASEHTAPFDFCHSVRIIPFQHPPWPRLFPGRLFNPLPSTVAHWTIPLVEDEIRGVLTENHYDSVHVLDLVLAQFFTRENTTIPMVLDRTRVDLQYQLMEQKRMNFSLKTRLLNMENLVKLWRFEKTVARRAALEVVCGPDDEQFLRQHVSRHVPIMVIPNGVDLDFFHPESAPDVRAADPTLIFCGAMDYNPNVDALRWFFSEIHQPLLRKVPTLRVLIVGKDPGQEVQSYAKREGVTVTGGVLDVRPYYKRAWVQVVPLRIGGGTRLKIVESLGIGTSVISTRIGAQGLNLEDEREILYAETTDQFISQTLRLLSKPDLRRKIELNGRVTARTRLAWKKLAADLSRRYGQPFGPESSPSDAMSEPLSAARNSKKALDAFTF